MSYEQGGSMADTRRVAKTRIIFTPEWGEYTVQAFNVNGKRMPQCDYYTDDKDDAKGTAKAMVGN